MNGNSERYQQVLTCLHHEDNLYWSRNQFFLALMSGLLGFVAINLFKFFEPAGWRVVSIPSLTPLLVLVVGGLVLTVSWFWIVKAGNWWIDRWHACLRDIEEVAHGNLRLHRVTPADGKASKHPSVRKAFRLTLWMFLLIWTTALLSLVTISCRAKSEAPVTEKPRVSEQVMAQEKKLFDLLTDTHKEFELVFSTTTYPDDDQKRAAKQWMREKDLYYELLRVYHLECSREPSPKCVAGMILTASGFVEVPEARFTYWDIKSASSKKYAKLSRLESLKEDFFVLATSLARDIK